MTTRGGNLGDRLDAAIMAWCFEQLQHARVAGSIRLNVKTLRERLLTIIASRDHWLRGKIRKRLEKEGFAEAAQIVQALDKRSNRR